MKVCNKCKKNKKYADFYKRSDRAGYKHVCKSCTKCNKLQVKYGVTKAYRDVLSHLQDHKCEICKNEKTLVVDHCHQGEQVRGLLCRGCNMALGLFKDSMPFLENAISYLEVDEILSYWEEE